jgi:hypothetical protein
MQQVTSNKIIEHLKIKAPSVPPPPPPPVMKYTPSGIGYYDQEDGPPILCPTVPASAVNVPCICPKNFPAPRNTPGDNKNYCTVCPEGKSLQKSSDGKDYCMRDLN